MNKKLTELDIFVGTLPDEAVFYVVSTGGSYKLTKAQLKTSLAQTLDETAAAGANIVGKDLSFTEGTRIFLLSIGEVTGTNISPGEINIYNLTHEFVRTTGLDVFMNSSFFQAVEWENPTTNETWIQPNESGTAASREYVDAQLSTLVVGLLDDRGNHDASGNTFPSSGGSGTAGAILKGDLWTISVAGTLGGVDVTIGDVVRAKVDSPGSTAANWAITENNIGYVPENAANKATTMTGNTASNVLFLTAKAVYDWAVATFQPLLSAANIATFLTGLSAASSISDTDELLINNGGTGKKTLWSTVKSVLRTYFNGYYEKIIFCDTTTYTSTATLSAQILCSKTITAADVVAGKITFNAKFKRAASGSNATVYLYANSSVSTSGAIALAMYTIPTTTLYAGVKRIFAYDGTNLYGLSGAVGASTDEMGSTSAPVDVAIDFATNNKIFWALVLNSTSDTITQREADMTNTKNL